MYQELDGSCWRQKTYGERDHSTYRSFRRKHRLERSRECQLGQRELRIQVSQITSQIRRDGKTLTGLAIKVCDTKDVDIAAVLRAGATDSCLTLSNSGSWHGHGASEEAEEGEE